MNKQNKILIISSIVIFIIALILFLYAIFSKSPSKNTNSTSKSEQINNAYIYDIDGKKILYSKFSGKPNVILLWKSDDINSYDILELFKKYYDNYKDSINFLAINVNEADINLNLIDDIKTIGYNFPVYFDTDFTLKQTFNYDTLPHLIFLEDDGSIGKEFFEAVTEDEFEANLDLSIKNY